MNKLTREWLRKAEADRLAARALHRGKASLHDQVCFLCQQAAEKLLKALLQERGLSIPRTHNLVVLVRLLAAHHPALLALRRGLDYLTRFAVDVRYPGEHARRRQAVAALRWAEQVRYQVRSLLGIRSRRGK
jgi:HEPN domain-containing protein